MQIKFDWECCIVEKQQGLYNDLKSLKLDAFNII